MLIWPISFVTDRNKDYDEEIREDSQLDIVQDVVSFVSSEMETILRELGIEELQRAELSQRLRGIHRKYLQIRNESKDPSPKESAGASIRNSVMVSGHESQDRPDVGIGYNYRNETIPTPQDITDSNIPTEESTAFPMNRDVPRDVGMNDSYWKHNEMWDWIDAPTVMFNHTAPPSFDVEPQRGDIELYSISTAEINQCSKPDGMYNSD
jgi:hypothetical protein